MKKTKEPGAAAKKRAAEILGQFQVAMALMSVIPLLGFIYLISEAAELTVRANTPQGFFTLMLVVVSILGMVLARFLISNVVKSLNRANAELERASEMKSSFLRNVAHEAATPLATVRNYMEAAQEGAYGELSPELRKACEVSLRQNQRLVRMVGDLLDIAKIEAGTLPMEFERADLTPLIHEAVDSACQGLAGNQALVHVACHPCERWVEAADRDRLVQVLVNLLRNAQKYSPEGADIEVRVRDAGAAFEIAVADGGDGIPDEMKQKIFDPFVRVTTRKKVGGVGLGLAIAQHIVSVHGGRIWVEDNKPAGSVFKFTLPKKASPHADGMTKPAAVTAKVK